jgi:RNA polymerase sigma-70 factor (ECF subfamily)
MAKLAAAYTDEELIDGCLKHDPRMQEKLYAKYYGKMLSVCFRYSRNKEDALELLNNGFLKVFLNVKSFQGKGSFEGWIRKIMLNTILEEHRKNISYKENIYFPDEEKDDVTIDAGILNNLYTEDIIKMISTLPAASRMVFNLFVMEGFSHKEISARLNISEGTSKWHVNFAKEKLKKKLESLYQVPNEVAYGR